MHPLSWPKNFTLPSMQVHWESFAYEYRFTDTDFRTARFGLSSVSISAALYMFICAAEQKDMGEK